VRVAVAIAGLADEFGALKSRMAVLSDHCNIAARRMVVHLERLASAGHIKAIDLSRQGRFHIQIGAAVETGAPKVEKPFRQIVGAVIAVTEQPAGGGHGKVHVYVEGSDDMTKVTIPRNGAEAIAAALVPAGARDALAAVS
jgi:hypothetical protein